MFKNSKSWLFKKLFIARKTLFSFSKCSEITIFPIKLHWNMIFLVTSRKVIFFSPKSLSYSVGGKWKMIFLKKIHRNMIYSLNVLKRWSFQKNRIGVWFFLYHQERWHFFFAKIWFFFTDGKWKMIFLKRYMKIWCFLYVW